MKPNQTKLIEIYTYTFCLKDKMNVAYEHVS